MPTPTEILKEEHELIRVGLHLLDRMCERMDANGGVPPAHLEKMLEFIQIFADQCHHGKEEELLFPAMEAGGVQKEGGPLCAMLMEHQMGRSRVKGMAASLEKIKKGDQKASQEFVMYAVDYLVFLSQHIEKENHCLFPMADMALTPEKQNELVEDFANLEITKIGRGKKKELEEEILELTAFYLAPSVKEL